MFDLRPNENNAFFFAALRQIGVFGQEAVPRMDCVYVVFMGNADNIFNI